MAKRWSAVLVLAVVAMTACPGIIAPTPALAAPPPSAVCVDDGLEPNNSFAQATPLAIDVDVDAQLCPDDRDMFALDLSAGETIRVDLTFTHAVGDLDLFLYSLEDGETRLASSEGNEDNEHLVHTVNAADTYYLIVYSEEANAAPYTIRYGAGVPCTDDDLEPNDGHDEATPLAIDTAVDAQICTSNRDYFAITLGDRQPIEVDLAFSSAEGDLDLALLDPWRTPLVTERDGVDGEHLEYTVEEAGTYYLVVSGFDGAVGPYTLQYGAGVTCVDDGLEPDDEAPDATPLPIDTVVSAQLCPWDRDLFAVDLAAGETIAVDLLFAHADGDLNLWLWAPDGSDIAFAVSTDDDEHLTFTVPAAGTYYLEVDGLGPSEAPYTIAYGEGVPCIDDANEPNDDIAGATPLPTGTPVAGRICNANEDFYEVVVADGAQLDVHLDFIHADGDLDLYLRDASGHAIAWSDGSVDDEHLQHTFATGGTFYIEISPYAAYDTPYELTATTGGSTSMCGPPPAPGTFPDVPGTHPFCTDIEWLVLEGITTGFPNGDFRPASDVTRQAMAAFVYRYSGSPAFVPPATPTFSDVGLTHPFYAEIEWMAAADIARGFDDGTFRPSGSITRQAMAAFMYRLAGEPAFSPPGTSTFSDVPLAHPFFAEIEWMASADITGGYVDGTFRPSAKVTRQAMAAFLHRFDGVV